MVLPLSAQAIIVGDWKLLLGKVGESGWTGWTCKRSTRHGHALFFFSNTHWSRDHLVQLCGSQEMAGALLRADPNSTTAAGARIDGAHNCSSGCLFNVATDRGEHDDLAATNSQVIPPIGAEGLGRRPPVGACRLFLGPGFRLGAR